MSLYNLPNNISFKSLFYFYIMLWGVFINSILIALILILILKWDFFRIKDLSRGLIIGGFILKITFSLGLYSLYTFHYQDRENADIFKYYDDALSIYQSEEFDITYLPKLFFPKESRSEEERSILKNTQHWDKKEQLLPNDNRFMIKSNLLLLFLSNGNYFFHLFSLAALSYIGCIGILKFAQHFVDIPSKFLFLIVSVSPSFAIWTSSMLKESLFIFFLGLFLYLLLDLIKKPKLSQVFAWILTTYLMLHLKTYLSICLLPFLLMFIAGLLPIRKQLRGLLQLLCFLLPIILGIIFIDSIIEQLRSIQIAYRDLAIESNAGSYFEIPVFESGLDSFTYIPMAFYNVWLRPIFNIHMDNLLSIFNGVESAIYLLVLIPLFLYYRKPSRKQIQLALFFLGFCLLGSLLIGSSIPILGASMRYRSPLLPFYLIAIFTFVDWKAIKSALFKKTQS